MKKLIELSCICNFARKMLHFYDKRNQILSNFKLEINDATKTILFFCALFHSHSYSLTKMDIFALDFTYYSRALMQTTLNSISKRAAHFRPAQLESVGRVRQLLCLYKFNIFWLKYKKFWIFFCINYIYFRSPTFITHQF